MNSSNQPSENAVVADSPLNKIFDFSDRISPMLVKELRQGLRGWGFVTLFIALQAIMLLFMFSLSLASSYGNLGEDVSNIIFLFFSIAALVIQPLRGMSSLSTEIKDDTIDLMVMTKLSAWRITLGKWVSLFSQTLLLLTALMPYLILRYFFGGMQLLPELLMLFELLVISGLSTALAVGLSALPSIILRGGAMLIVIGFTSVTVMSMFAGRGAIREILGFLSFQEEGLANLLLGLLFLSIYGILFFLDFGASQIAPKAENRATPRRLVSTAILAICFLVFAFNSQPEIGLMGCIFTLIASVPLLMFSMNEPMELAPRVVRPFIKRGQAGRLYGRILYPGWCAGSYFAVGMIILLFIIFSYFLNQLPYSGYSDNEEVYTVLSCMTGILIAPAVFARLFWRNASSPFSAYLAFFGGMFIISIVAMMIDESSPGSPASTVLFFLPSINLFKFIGSSGMSDSAMLTLSSIVTFGYAAILIGISTLRGGHLYSSLENHMASAMQKQPENETPDIPPAKQDTEKSA